MSDDTGEPQKPKMRFRKHANRARMPVDQAKRQGAIATLAFTQFGDRDGALDFLNTHHPLLAARPIDVATDSEDGFRRVAALLTGD